ncbi:uncharacterized protein LOC116127528 [Pistacia vera]|uniref:uncharacterized protein LOC116127528 n=1 Tax=Pistacia vera TaxID=55513 RepID=UPI0012634DE2|nr:uncharacterized protein LOC116127528 [Pistacia vera]
MGKVMEVTRGFAAIENGPDPVKIKTMKCVNHLELFHNINNENIANQGRLLGLDVGTKYVRVAIFDPDNKHAIGLNVLYRSDGIDYNSDELIKMEMQKEVADFVDMLSTTGKLKGLEYTYQDENHSTKEAEQLCCLCDIAAQAYALFGSI